ncbi:hypothetical protein I6A60_01950 [Frankia sp. AgB1.9]|uniref:hypothetical protein n=1 Tax=unclassified Frankia TaxID=2632575 RepID=UPI001932EE00|nr:MULTISPECIES: hypothetical protein [unclassified Frankia]MBL7489017.1 hypothetical protein [Frankia sp. AgW1.1]MBL7546649.1 hypothetical protein [Frankia sp. AgB1.9]MBL7624681.1 hypothetical protein [Frankia sp. AgB1.8]
MAASGSGVALGVQPENLEALVQALKDREDGKELRKQLLKSLREAVKPAVADAKSGAMMIPARGTAKPALRAGIAKKIRAEVKASGRWTGIRIKARKTPNLRSFPNAPKRTQRAQGWKHKVFGRDEWVIQRGKPDWFDAAMAEHAGDYRAAVAQVLEDFARSLAEQIDS